VVGWGIAVVGFRDLDLTGVLIATPCGIVVTTFLSRFALGLEEAPWRLIARRMAAAAPAPSLVTAVVPDS